MVPVSLSGSKGEVHTFSEKEVIRMALMETCTLKDQREEEGARGNPLCNADLGLAVCFESVSP